MQHLSSFCLFESCNSVLFLTRSLLERNLNKEKASKNFGTEIIVKIKNERKKK
jgi:hypothetical protein